MPTQHVSGVVSQILGQQNKAWPTLFHINQQIQTMVLMLIDVNVNVLIDESIELGIYCVRQ